VVKLEIICVETTPPFRAGEPDIDRTAPNNSRDIYRDICGECIGRGDEVFEGRAYDTPGVADSHLNRICVAADKNGRDGHESTGTRRGQSSVLKVSHAPGTFLSACCFASVIGLSGQSTTHAFFLGDHPEKNDPIRLR
jgi:hypothetical protein